VPELGAIPSGVVALLAAAWRARYCAMRAPLTSACTS